MSFIRGVGLDNLQRSLPSLAISWFSENHCGRLDPGIPLLLNDRILKNHLSNCAVLCLIRMLNPLAAGEREGRGMESLWTAAKAESAPCQLCPVQAAPDFLFYLSREMPGVVSPAVETFSGQWVSRLLSAIDWRLWRCPCAVVSCIVLFQDNGLWIHVRHIGQDVCLPFYALPVTSILSLSFLSSEAFSDGGRPLEDPATQ